MATRRHLTINRLKDWERERALICAFRKEYSSYSARPAMLDCNLSV